MILVFNVLIWLLFVWFDILSFLVGVKIFGKFGQLQKNEEVISRLGRFFYIFYVVAELIQSNLGPNKIFDSKEKSPSAIDNENFFTNSKVVNKVMKKLFFIFPTISIEIMCYVIFLDFIESQTKSWFMEIKITIWYLLEA